MQTNASLFAKLNPVIKGSGLFLIMFALIATTDWVKTLVFLGLAFGLLLLSGWGPFDFLKRLAPYSLLFLLTFWMMAAFGKGTNTLWSFGWFHVTSESVAHGWLLALRMLTFVCLSLAFVTTTDATRFVMSLIHQAKISPRFAYGFLAGIRFLPQLVEEVRVLRQVRMIRNVHSRFPGDAFLSIGLPLFSRSIQRAERMAIAIEARHFSAERTYYEVPVVQRQDIIYLVVIFLFISLVFWL
ncbi:energy-coupling factor transporter transmembrane component T [Exiguobacterium sp. SL14]|nr:energy-coupling factor transporter transmembrane component T [Exiguobacterium sp. SL14]MCY1691081.1 energy-coupling factor transporter transmembrane component T [Exiguobacterium sp. SL14]